MRERASTCRRRWSSTFSAKARTCRPGTRRRTERGRHLMLQAAFTLLGTSVTWLEAVAFTFALACVVCNVYEIHWGWPLLVVSSALYGWLFFVSRLYGDVVVQLYFALSSLWGWWEWVFGRRRTDATGQAGTAGSLRVARLAGRARIRLLALWLAAWPLLGAILA